MPYRKDSNTGLPGTAPNQFAQVGMGGSQGGGQFEQGENESGSLQSGQGGTSAEQEVFGSDTDANASRETSSGGQQEQDEARRQRSPGAASQDFGSDGDEGTLREDDQGGSNI